MYDLYMNLMKSPVFHKLYQGKFIRSIIGIIYWGNCTCWYGNPIGIYSDNMTFSILSIYLSVRYGVNSIGWFPFFEGALYSHPVCSLYCSRSIISASSPFDTPHMFDGTKDSLSRIILLIWMRSYSLGSPWIWGRVVVGKYLFIASTLGTCLGSIFEISLGNFLVG